MRANTTLESCVAIYLTLGFTALCLCSEAVARAPVEGASKRAARSKRGAVEEAAPVEEAPKPKRAARGKKAAVVEEAAAPIEKAPARKGKRSYDVGAIMSRREGVQAASVQIVGSSCDLLLLQMVSTL